MPANKAKRSSKLERTAYHEAGHAVIATELRLPFKRISVIEDEDSLGRVIFDLPDWFSPDVSLDRKSERLIEHHILVGLAGMAAEHKLTGRTNWRGAHGDKDCAIDLALYRFRPDVAGPYINYLKSRVRANMDRPFTWESVKRLAEALLIERQVSATSARKIIKSVYRLQ